MLRVQFLLGLCFAAPYTYSGDFMLSGDCTSAVFHVSLEKERKDNSSIYIAPFILRIVSRRSDMDHTVLPANYTMPAFPS